MTTDLDLTKEQDAMFQPGCFVVLHPNSKHPDAGRVGKIISRKGSEMLVEFWRDDLIGKSEFRFSEASRLGLIEAPSRPKASAR